MNPVETLKAVLCGQDGKCCIAGSEADRKVVDEALAALDAEQPEPLITVESSLRFRLESEKQKSDDLLDEVRELKGKLLQAQSVPVNAVLLSEMQIATLINKHFYVGMAPDYSHYKAFALGVLTAAQQAQPEPVNAVLLDALKNAEKAIELAYMEGFYDMRTYNDVQTNDENESWRASAAFVSFKYIGATLTAAQQAQPERAPSTKGSDQVWFAQNYGIKQGGQHE